MKTHNRHLIIILALVAIMLGLENWGWGQERNWPGGSAYKITQGEIRLYPQANGKFKASWPNQTSNPSVDTTEREYDFIYFGAGDASSPTGSGIVPATNNWNYNSSTSYNQTVTIKIIYTTGDEEPIKTTLIDYRGSATVSGDAGGVKLVLKHSIPNGIKRTKPTLIRYTNPDVGSTAFSNSGPLIEVGRRGSAESTKTCWLTIEGTATNPFIIDGGSRGLTADISNENANDYKATIGSGGITATSSLIYSPYGGKFDLQYVTFQNNWNNNSSNPFSALEFGNHTVYKRALEVTMQHVTIKNCYAADGGAAMFLNAQKELTASGGNTLTSYLTMQDCTIENCFANGTGANSGGIIRTHRSTHDMPITATDCIFRNNFNRWVGGAITWWADDVDLTLNGCTIENNHARYEGGGIYTNGPLILGGTTIQNNRVCKAPSEDNMYGAGILLYYTGITVSRKTIVKGNEEGNYSTDGGFTRTWVSDVDFVYGEAANKYVTIGSSGLLCGSSIGLCHTRGVDNVIATGTDANCLAAYRNHCFFDDQENYSVYRLSSDATHLYFKSDWYGQAKTATSPTDYEASGGFVTKIKTNKGLAYFAKDVNSGKDYSDKKVVLTNDINMLGYSWCPIGNKGTTCTDAPATTPFTGTFDGQGHTISGLTNSISTSYDNWGLFGYLTDTIKNTFVSFGTLPTSATNMGGLVGQLDGGEVYNCMSTLTGGSATALGALVGTITSGTVKNCYAISSNNACGSGTVTNCYVRNSSGTGTATNVGSGGSTTGSFTATSLPYTYGTVDNTVSVGSTPTPLVKLLNQWVDAQGSGSVYAHWARPTTTTINGDYPILKMSGSNAVAAHSSTPNELHYGDINSLITSYNTTSHAIYLYGSKTGVSTHAANTSKLYIDEDAAITQTGDITAYVGVTLKNTQASDASSWDWHMFSSALTAAPLGINYIVSETNENTASGPRYGYGEEPPVYNLTGTGYFPTANAADYLKWDYYCYYEPQYHWINFKRNGPSHWHEDAPYGVHDHIDYVSDAGTNVNESTMKPGKGYLLATKDETLLQCEGTLNNDNVSIAVTTDGPFRKGYNFIGNPYQSYYDFNTFASDNPSLWGGTSNASYILLSGKYYTSYAYNASNNVHEAPRWLHPHQGFMIVARNSGTATFYNNKRITEGYSAFRDEQPNYPLVNLIATDEDGKGDITTVELGRPDKGGAVKAYDLHLGKGCIYTHYEDEDYAIAFTQPGLTEAAIRFETDEEATFTMTWDTENGDFSYLHLIDNMTGSDIDCLTTEEYRFASTPDDYKSRFRLVFGYTGIEESEAPEPVEGPTTFAFQMGSQLVVNGEGYLEMIDMTGRIVGTETLTGSQSTVPMPRGAAGVYVLRLTGRDGVRTQKMVVR